MRRRFFRAAQGKTKGELELAAAGLNPAETASLLENAVDNLQAIAVGRERTALFDPAAGSDSGALLQQQKTRKLSLVRISSRMKRSPTGELHAACTAFSITFITSEARSGSDRGSEAGAAA